MQLVQTQLRHSLLGTFMDQMKFRGKYATLLQSFYILKGMVLTFYQLQNQVLKKEDYTYR